ncbi:helix-turn-helix domain-containing protein [Sulfitobacter sp. S190]|uniref:helix-turn-helix domain-containing protein n=1 Tax=Sulfitobacter sp. S190 TaxID=2867022 RepID=UPI0021A40393|nr:helix-turn-helix domain-containing protein [Sulfitobacter sp. S190]UWR24475.1 helix-turn-helix domain-containing protein [Sulfitobacter sp. S190]
MSEIPHCDPAQGFVAFPVAIFDLDLSPAAFRLLAELCRMANTDGQCWPSLAQLGRRMGRSRAAVSGYITELRATGVLSTEEQRMANGYNYRLRYTVTFWKAFRAGLRKPPAASKPERTVQRNERPLETKNHNHKKQQSLVLQKSSKLIARWKASVGNAPYPAFEHRPLETDIIEAERLLSEITEHSTPVISADIETAPQLFCGRSRTDRLHQISGGGSRTTHHERRGSSCAYDSVERSLAATLVESTEYISA